MARQQFKAIEKHRLLRALKGVYVALGSVKASLIKIKLWDKASPEYLEAIDRELKQAEQLLKSYGLYVPGAKLIWKKEEPKDEETKEL